MMGNMNVLRLAWAAGFLGVAAALAGCGSDGVEVNSKLLGYFSTGSSHKEPELSERAPLVVPPTTAQLPVPGSGKAVAADLNSQLPQSAEQKIAAADAAKKAEAQAKCDKYKAAGPRTQVGDSPDKPCPGIFDILMGGGQSASSDPDATQ
jgi:hypothetical protein